MTWSSCCVNVGRGCACADRLERAAFALFAAQADTWDLPEAAARMEWEADPDLRGFWHGQVLVVLEALRGEPA